MDEESLIDQYQETIQIMSQQIMILKEKLSENNIYNQIREKIKKKTTEIDQLSQECIEIKKHLWSNRAKKKWLESEIRRIKNETLLSETILQGLKSKYEICKGTQVEKILLKVIRSYERYHSMMNSLRQLTYEKEDLLQNYKTMTKELSQESNVRVKAKSIKDYSKGKERTTNELENKLRSLRKEIEDTKNSLDKGEVKRLLETRNQIEQQILDCAQDQKVLSIEISSINQAIQLEKNVNSISPEVGNRALKTKLYYAENQIADIVKVIKGKEKEKEKEREKAKVKAKASANVKAKEKEEEKEQGRPTAENNGKNRPSSIEVSSRLSGTVTSSITPQNRPKISKSIVSSPILKLDNRDKIIKLLGNGINHQNSKTVQKAFKSFGNEKQSIASKIVQLNREIIT